MEYFIDTEFIEPDEPGEIDLISIALVDKNGREYYAISNEFDPRKANDYVKQRVLSQLPERQENLMQPGEESPRRWEEAKLWKSRATIRKELLAFVNSDADGIDFWGAWCAYDWVVFCRVFGQMKDLPANFPRHCNDLMQWTRLLGLNRDFLPPETTNSGNALADARWTRDAYDVIKRYVSVTGK